VRKVNKLWVITKEIYKKNVKSFGFIALVFGPLLFIALSFAVGYFFSQSADDSAGNEAEIAVVSETEAITQSLVQVENSFTVDENITSEEQAREALGDDEIDGYVIAEAQNGTISANVIHDDSLSNVIPTINEQLTGIQMSLRAEQLGLSPEEATSLIEPVEVQDETVTIENGEIVEESNEDSIQETVQQASAYVVNIAIFIFIISYASIIAEEVANEKGSKIMEIILSSATATQHFFGKLFGVVLMILTQIVIYVAAGLGAFLYFRDHELVQQVLNTVDLNTLISGLLGYSLIFFILGVLMYMVVSAFLGSLATKQEDVNKVVTPLIFLVLFGFYIGNFALTSPDNLFIAVTSHIPLLTPFIMPFRIATESVGNVELWISIGASLLTTVLLTLLSLAFYRSNVLVYSDANIFANIRRSWNIMQSNRRAKKNN